jgi:predicted PurR-regulated permease PerM
MRGGAELDDRVPASLRLAAALAWRFMVIALAAAVLALALASLRIVILPVVVALLLATLLLPPVGALRKRGWPSGLATLITLAGGLLAFVAVVSLIVTIAAVQFEELRTIGESAGAGMRRLTDWLADGPFGISQAQVDRWVDQMQSGLQQNAARLAGGAFSGALVLIEVVAGGVLALVLLFFFLKDGERMWAWIRAAAPREQQADLDALGRRAWAALGGYLRAQVVVALVDAALIGLVLVVLRVPLAIPLAVLIFFGAFIPIVGAFVAGALAVLVALAAQGFVSALIVLGANLVVQQLEGNLLQPLLVGRSVRLHPVVVLLAVVIGATIWGIPGAFVAVPLTAVLYTSGSYLRQKHDEGAAPEEEPEEPEDPTGEPAPDRAGT